MKEEFEHQLLLERRKVADGEARNRRLETEQVGENRINFIWRKYRSWTYILVHFEPKRVKSNYVHYVQFHSSVFVKRYF